MSTTDRSMTTLTRRPAVLIVAQPAPCIAAEHHGALDRRRATCRGVGEGVSPPPVVRRRCYGSTTAGDDFPGAARVPREQDWQGLYSAGLPVGQQLHRIVQ